MNKLKIYLRTEGNILEQANVYAKVFEGKVLKKSFWNKNDNNLNRQDNKENIWTFSYITIVDDINILIAKHKIDMATSGYQGDYVLSLTSQDLFNKILTNMKESPYFRIDYDTMKENWGTQIAKFYDKWGYGWIIESKY